MIETYVQEFLAVVTYLIQHDKGRIKNNVLIVEKSLVCQFLDRNMYEPADSKLAVWRGLRWIQTEPKRLTKKVRNGSQLYRAVVIDLIVYEALKNIVNFTANSNGNK